MQHGFGFRRGHVSAGDPVVIVPGDGDVSVPVVDAEQDLVARQEARVFEHGIGNLHPRKGRTPVAFVRAVSFKRQEMRVMCSSRERRGLRLASAIVNSCIELVVVSGS